MPGSQFDRLRELQDREEAMLAAMQDERAMLPTDEELARSADSLAGVPPPTPSAEPPRRERLALGSPAQAFRDTTSNEYEYKDPKAPGAAPGKQGGPMASELKGLPGVVHRGPDGMDRVDPGRLSLHTASAVGELARADDEKNRELEDLRDRIDALSVGVGGDDPDETMRAALSGRY